MKEKLEYTYIFANGDVITLSAKGIGTNDCEGISGKWIEILQELDRKEALNDRAETRRHYSIERIDPYGVFLIENNNGEARLDESLLQCAFCQLLSKQEQRFAIWKFIDGYTTREMAEMSGLSIRRTQEILHGINKKIKEI